MALTSGIFPGKVVGVVKPVLVAGSFKPNTTSAIDSSYNRGAGWSVAYSATGIYTVTFNEIFKRVVGFGADVMIDSWDGTRPFIVEAISCTDEVNTTYPGVDTQSVLVLQATKEGTTGAAFAATAITAATNSRISFWVLTEESAGYVQ